MKSKGLSKLRTEAVSPHVTCVSRSAIPKCVPEQIKSSEENINDRESQCGSVVQSDVEISRRATKKIL
jgi:hypothetical protein